MTGIYFRFCRFSVTVRRPAFFGRIKRIFVVARPKIKYDAEVAKYVQGMAKVGVPQKKIAIVIGLSEPTLARLYGAELSKGAAEAAVAIGGKLFEKAMSGDTPSLIFWAKTQMGWREKDKADSTQAAKVDRKQELVEAIREAYRSVGKCS